MARLAGRDGFIQACACPVADTIGARFVGLTGRSPGSETGSGADTSGTDTANGAGQANVADCAISHGPVEAGGLPLQRPAYIVGAGVAVRRTGCAGIEAHPETESFNTGIIGGAGIAIVAGRVFGQRRSGADSAGADIIDGADIAVVTDRGVCSRCSGADSAGAGITDGAGITVVTLRGVSRRCVDALIRDCIT